MKHIQIISVGTTLVLAFILGFISVEFLGDYGWSVFVFIPFVIGFLPPYISGRQLRLTRKIAYKLSFITLAVTCFALLVFAIEGLICLLMASPLLILVVWLGSYLGYKSYESRLMNSTNTLMLLVFLSLGFSSFDYLNEPKNLIPVRTEIVVNAPIQEVWKNVVTFDKIEEPTDSFFKTGISYPINATIVGRGVGAIRYCNFTTGSFVEPITTWDEPNLLQFDVKQQPTPMNELNPFWEVYPPHLDV